MREVSDLIWHAGASDQRLQDCSMCIRVIASAGERASAVLGLSVDCINLIVGVVDLMETCRI